MHFKKMDFDYLQGIEIVWGRTKLQALNEVVLITQVPNSTVIIVCFYSVRETSFTGVYMEESLSER
jgi:hypothetical protein